MPLRARKVKMRAKKGMSANSRGFDKDEMNGIEFCPTGVSVVLMDDC